MTGEVFTLSNFYFNPNMDGFYNRNKLTTNNAMNKMNTTNLKLSPGSHTLSTPSFPKELSLSSGRTRRAVSPEALDRERQNSNSKEERRVMGGKAGGMGREQGKRFTFYH